MKWTEYYLNKCSNRWIWTTKINGELWAFIKEKSGGTPPHHLAKVVYTDQSLFYQGEPPIMLHTEADAMQAWLDPESIIMENLL